MRLYDLTEQYQDILDLLRDEPDSEELQAMLEGLEGAIEEKVENIVKVAKTLEYEAKAIGEEVKRLQVRKIYVENNRRKLIENAKTLLEEAGLDKLRGKMFSIWVQNNPPSVQIVDEELVPERFMATVQVIKKQDIIDAIKNGEEVPGVEIVQGKGLRVR